MDKEWKRQLGALKKDIKAKLDGFAQRLNAAVDALDDAGAGALLLMVFSSDMLAILERYIAAQRKQVVAAFENWWDKYRVTLTDIERERDSAAELLRKAVRRLGYA